MTFKPLISETAPKDHKSIVEAYLKDINYWMNINKLKLNGKTELLNLIQSTHRPLPPLQNINCGTEMIKPTKFLVCNQSLGMRQTMYATHAGWIQQWN